jgi:integral membrane protein
LNDRSAIFHPLTLVRAAGIIDGVSLLVLLCIAMPLKYWAGMPLAVTIVGTAHGGIFIVYLLAVVYAQVRLQWHVKWTLLSVLAGFVPAANFILERYFRKHSDRFPIRPIPKIWLVYAIVLFTFIDLFTQLPVMSTYAGSLGASAAVAGFVVGMYSLSNTFGNVFSGMMTDKYGAYPILSSGLLLSSASLLLYSAVDNVTGLVLLRFLHGFCSGLIVPAAFAYLANQTRSEKQGSRSAITGSFVGIAAIVGPAYSGIMASRTSVPFVFATVAVLGLALFAATLRYLKTHLDRTARDKRGRGKLRLNKGTVQAYAGAFFLMFSQGALAYLLPLHVERLGYSSRLSGTLMSMFGIVAVALFVLPTNRWFDKVPPLATLATGLGLMGVSQILIGHNSGMYALYAVLAMYGVGFALLFPSMNTLLIRSTASDHRGQAYGYFYALFSLGVVAGSSGIGLLPVSLERQFWATGLVLLACVLGLSLSAVRFRR